MGKILFVQIGAGFRTPNRHLIKHLQFNFPEDQIHLIDLLEIVKRNPYIIVVNALLIIVEYFKDFLTGKKRFTRLHHYYLGTSYIFKVFSEFINRQLTREKYKFVFQTQGLCDASNPLGIPYFIYTDHTNLNNLNYKYSNSKTDLHSQKHRNLEKSAYENARLIFVMSKNIAESLVNQYHISQDKIKLVYAGANTPTAKELNEQRYHAKNIVFVGKDWERKGGPLLVEAFKIVQQSIPEASLTIVGCKPKVALKNCKAYGELSLKGVSRIYSRATLFCMPTTLEPFGIVFLEAMFHSLPIVTNDVGAISDFVIDDFNGYRLHHDAGEYASVLVRLLQDPGKCKLLGYNSYRIVSKNYTWEKVAESMSKHIKESL